MSDRITNTQKPQTRRPLLLALVGLLFLCAAGFMVFDRLQIHTTIAPLPHKYKYDIQQATHSKVNYKQSSFFDGSPSPVNSAYLAGLTDTIDAQFHYNYFGSETTKLTYQYEAYAVLRGTFGGENSEGGLASVWTKRYQLLSPIPKTQTTRTVTVDRLVHIPFADYRQQLDQFRTAFNAPLNGEVAITYVVQVSGNIHGTPFTDSKTTTITASLDQQIYKLAVKFEKTDHKEVLPAQSQRLQDTITAYEIPVAILFFVAGFVCVVYGFRRQLFKTPYVRELEKIYRYHDGIIIRASRPISLVNKNIVPVQTFNDLLILEEEITAPIIASPVSDTATQFLITRDDIVYVYTLGEYSHGPEEASDDRPLPPAPRRQVSKSRVSG
jgi:hypothetical protein